MTQRVFVGSSVEALHIAWAIQKNLCHSAEVTVWNQGIFQLSRSSLQSLVSALETFDFGIFVFSPDDMLTMRGEEHRAVRDNVIFELGLFIGELGQSRCFILIPDGVEELRLPTDLLGVTPGTYEAARSDNRWEAGTGSACFDIRRELQLQGRRITHVENAEGTAPAVELPDHASMKPESKPVEEPKPAQEYLPFDPWLDLLMERRLPEALNAIDTVIHTEADPSKHFELRLWRAFIQLEHSPVEGEIACRGLATETPHRAGPWTQLAHWFINNGFREKALAVTEEGLALLPNNSALLIAKAQSLDVLQRAAEAEAILAERIESGPDIESLESVFTQLCRLQAAHGKSAEASVSVTRGLERFPFSTELLEIKANLLFSANDYGGTVSAYRQLIKLKPQEGSYHALMGNSLLALDLYGLALDAYRQGDTLARGNLAWIVANIGNVLNNRGFFGFALEFLERALAADPSSEYAQDRILTAKRNRAAELQRLEAAVNESFASAQASTAERP
jgi:tetratricopeptide (TPR) repeat protein